jgi:hypothetical protein
VTERSPGQVLLFSGHMIDALGREPNRFPPRSEAAAAAAIGVVLDELQAGPADLAICGGAGGGDLLFAEACHERGVPLEILIPFEEQPFLAASVDPSGAGWRERFLRLVAGPGVSVSSAAEAADEPERSSAFERNNEHMLERSLIWGAERLQFIALWDGRGGDGAGGTAGMVEAVRRQTKVIHIIGTQTLRTR